MCPLSSMETEPVPSIVWFEPNTSCHNMNRSRDRLTYLLPVLHGSFLFLIEFMKWQKKRYPLELNVRKLCFPFSFFFFPHCGIVSIFLDMKVNLQGNSMEYLIYSYSSRNNLNKDLYNIFIQLFFCYGVIWFCSISINSQKIFFKVNSQINSCTNDGGRTFTQGLLSYFHFPLITSFYFCKKIVFINHIKVQCKIDHLYQIESLSDGEFYL